MHLISYIDARLSEYNDTLTGKIDAVQQEVYHLTTSISSWMEKTPASCLEACEKLIDEAIPHHPENPDASPQEKRKEHRAAHSRWIKNVLDEMERWKRIREEAYKWGVIVALGFIGTAVWKLFLEGPK